MKVHSKHVLFVVVVSFAITALAGCEFLLMLLNDPPSAAAVATQNGDIIELDGSESDDPDGDELSFEWDFISVPSESALEDDDIEDNTEETASFVPDVDGTYTVRLTVRDKYDTASSATVSVDAVADVAADAGPTASVDLVSLSPPSPATVGLNEDITVNFSYETDDPNGVRIFCRPMSGGSLTANYTAHPSGLYTGTGTGSGWFDIASAASDVTIDQVRIQVWDADQTVLYTERFFDVSYLVDLTRELPDLVVSSITVEATTIEYEAEPWTWAEFTVENLGTGTVPAGTVRAVIVNRTQDGTSISSSGYFDVSVPSGLGPGDTATHSFAVGHDSYWPVGAYTLQVWVDSDEVIEETDETNNVSNTLSFEVVSAGPSASVSLLSLSPTSPATVALNENITVDFGIHTDDPNGVRVFCRPMSNGSLTANYTAHPSGLYTGTGNGSGWFNIASATEDVTIDQVRIQVWDADQTVLYTERFFDVSYLVDATPELPDLVVSSITVEAATIEYEAEPWTWAEFTIQNLGPGTVPAGRVQAVMVNRTYNGSAITSPGHFDVLVPSDLGPGDTATHSFAVGHDSYWPVGTFTVQVWVDSDEVIEETDETNNVSDTLSFEVVSAVEPYVETIAYIYDTDTTMAAAMQSQIESYGWTCDLIDVADAGSVTAGTYDLFVIGYDTGSSSTWDNSAAVSHLNGMDTCFLAIGGGGSCFYSELGLSGDWGAGMFNSTGTTDMVFMDADHDIYNTPNNFTATTYTMFTAPHGWMRFYAPSLDGSVEILAVDADYGYPDSVMASFEDGRYFYWAYTDTLSEWSSNADDLFENIIYFLLHTTPPAAPVALIDSPVGFDTGGDGLGRGFYISEYPGTTLDQVNVWISSRFNAGTYTIELTVREGSYTGAVIGSAQQSVDLSGVLDDVELYTFDFDNAPATKGAIVTFDLQYVSGPSTSLYYSVHPSVVDPLVIQTNEKTSLDDFRRDGVAVQVYGME